MGVNSWLKHCVTSRIVAGPIPDEVIGFFNYPNFSSRTGALRSTQHLIEMSTRNLPGCKGRPVRKVDLTAIYEPIIDKIWEPRRLTTLWASTAYYRASFAFSSMGVNSSLIYIYDWPLRLSYFFIYRVLNYVSQWSTVYCLSVESHLLFFFTFHKKTSCFTNYWKFLCLAHNIFSIVLHMAKFLKSLSELFFWHSGILRGV
jgi:hypothetical protein